VAAAGRVDPVCPPAGNWWAVCVLGILFFVGIGLADGRAGQASMRCSISASALRRLSSTVNQSSRLLYEKPRASIRCPGRNHPSA